MIIEIHMSNDPHVDANLMIALSNHIQQINTLQNAQELKIDTYFGIIRVKRVNLRLVTYFYPFKDIAGTAEKENVPSNRA